MDHVVIDHHLDEDAGVYRVVIGRPIESDVPEADENGVQIVRCSECSEIVQARSSQDDRVVYGGHADDCSRSALAADTPSVVRQVVGHVDVEDFLFDAQDARWFTEGGERRPKDDIAAEQRGAITSALLSREQAAQGPLAEAIRDVSTMPGVGGLLVEEDA